MHRNLLELSLKAIHQNNLPTAIHHMRQASEAAPNIVMYKRNLGELLRRAKLYDEAINTHLSANSLENNSAEGHYLLALVYNDSYQFELAIQHYHIAISIDQNHGLAWNNLGAALESTGDKQMAKVAYATAIALNIDHAEAQNNLGAIYSEEGKLEQARLHFIAAIKANPDFIDAHYNLSLIKTYQVNDPHIVYLESIRNKISQYPELTQGRYYFTLGKILDDTKQFQRAYQAYAEGNRLYYQHQPWDRNPLKTLVEQIPNTFTKNFLKPIQNVKNNRCPIFIVGMPRSGTTLIEQILSTHSEVYGAGELSILDKIIQSFCHATGLPLIDWIKQLTDKEFINLGEEYLNQTSELAPEKTFIIDKMPSNCFYIGMIYRMFPAVKIIHAIRDPMDSCFSCFTHLFKVGMTFANNLEALGTYYSYYAKVMQHWQTVLPNNTIFNLSYEELVKNQEVMSKKLVEYVGLNWEPNCLDFYKNSRSVKTASLTQVRKPIYQTSVQRWRYFADELTPLMNIVAPFRNIKGISA